LEETVLWRLVLRQALWDVQAEVLPFDPNLHKDTLQRRAEREREKASVINWLGTADFRAVCEMADVDPSYMEGKLRAEV
jgi:hypothetical protein